MSKESNNLLKNLGLRYKAHPWHGISVGEDAPEVINTFIEIVPTDQVKYEIDKETGYLMVDRPQKFSNIVPALYGFVPQTYCDDEVAKNCADKNNLPEIVGDQDPLDICVLTERQITHGNLIVPAIPIGGFRMIDGGEADDKIIAVLKGDEVYQQWKDVSDVPASVINRLKHYFLTYKEIPAEGQKPKCEIVETYGKEEALEVIKKSQLDYQNKFGNIDESLSASLEALK
ncbi:MAG: inorganic pyrophosphatase [Cytophagales bacterium]|nr:inorganic pyrophosphatase [Cytophagales bacterium]